jgi:hypothetical protein
VIVLVRNLCANDEIKSPYCGGRQSVVQELIQIMNSTFRDKTGFSHALLLEHACGTIAASLRISRNATYLANLVPPMRLSRHEQEISTRLPCNDKQPWPFRHCESFHGSLSGRLAGRCTSSFDNHCGPAPGLSDEVYAALGCARDYASGGTGRCYRQDGATATKCLESARHTFEPYSTRVKWLINTFLQ